MKLPFSHVFHPAFLRNALLKQTPSLLSKSFAPVLQLMPSCSWAFDGGFWDISPALQPNSERFQQGSGTVPVFRGVHFRVTSPRPQRLKPNRFALKNLGDRNQTCYILVGIFWVYIIGSVTILGTFYAGMFHHQIISLGDDWIKRNYISIYICVIYIYIYTAHREQYCQYLWDVFLDRNEHPISSYFDVHQDVPNTGSAFG